MKYRRDPERANWGQDAFVGDGMGKWAILCLNDNLLYWCYGDDGNPREFTIRKDLRWGRYRGLIDTWSREFSIYEADESFDEVRGEIFASGY